MFDSLGFFGTKAPLFLDMVGLYFLLLPFLLFISIRFAVKKRVSLHLQTQTILFVMSLVMVVLFEVGVRIAGGFNTFLEQSSVNEDFFIGFLIIHVITALLTLNLWSYQIIASIKAYRHDALQGAQAVRHKRIGRYSVIAITLTIAQGAAIYLMLFVF